MRLIVRNKGKVLWYFLRWRLGWLHGGTDRAVFLKPCCFELDTPIKRPRFDIHQTDYFYGLFNGVASDVGAVQKDSHAIAKDNAELASDRTAKTKDKANGNLGGQAVDSLSIGDDKVMKSEKQTKKSTDNKILNHDVNAATDK